MSRCLSSSMTGSTDAGPLQPQEDPVPLPVQPSTFERPVSEDSSLTRRDRRRHQPRRKMTSAPPSGQTIQLTPLWEHVVRTRRFPSEVDTQATFVEISERLRDPEWEVRQHALRVLMDVLPTLNADVVDKVMQPVVPELINNLGHPAPAVRKGALDTLRVYLVHSPNRDSMVKNILHDGLNRPDAHNPFQTNVTTGVILSAPLLLFPSSDSPAPTSQVLKDATVAFASRLVQVPHQEAVLKSLMKIRDAVGEEEFEGYLADYDDNMKKNIEILSKIYNIRPGKRKQGRKHATDIIKADKERVLDKSHWDSDSDTSGIAEEEDETPNGTGPPGRVVLETEIKFNEETAITMTILEEKDDEEEDSEEDGEQEDVEESDTVDVLADPFSEDKRKTPRRVHFGGEIVKLRTPDSDETESIEIAAPKTRIPLPVSPATKMPERARRRPWSQPCSPHAEKRGSKRASRSASSSPKREAYTHNAQLSPKKSILARTTSGGPVIVVDPATEEMKSAKERRNGENTVLEDEGSRATGSSQQSDETSNKEQAAPSSPSQGEKKKPKDDDDAPTVLQVATAEEALNTSATEERVIPKRGDNRVDAVGSNENDVVEVTSRQSKDHVLTEAPSPSRRSHIMNREDTQVGDEAFEMEGGRLNERNVVSGSDFFFGEVKSNVNVSDLAFGSPVYECNARINRLVGGDFVDEIEQVAGLITEVDSDGEQKGRGQRDRKNASESNGSVTCSSSEGEGKPQEPNWEELGLVSQEVLDDLHNKDDWRARVRALERVASALRTSSALIAIESRLGSLLHAVLGGERSCRVAAAGLTVAKVVVAGVSEDALKKKLPQLAWGLARQGGPAAAQLARIAMIRLKPSLFLEQMLQPHCLSARNAKTRENALQLLIFSLVTFPSTEFKLETVANRVAMMVADRRRRVRQAALDTLAVLAQIYDPEEVLQAGRRAGDGSPDAEAMLAAIRARLARKSLPLVSADGLVVYGLQISPTVQIATGPDVDWIVAGSGSVSPGTGRTRGQIIATSRSAQGRASRNVNNNRESPWTERPNLVALGVGLQSKSEQSVAWQILPSQSNDDNEDEITGPNGRNANAGVPPNFNLRFGEQLRSSYTSSTQLHDPVGTDSKNLKEISDNNFGEQKARSRKDLNEIAKEKDTTVRGESKIPVLLMRERHKITSQNREKSVNLEYVNLNLRKQTKDALDSNRNRINSRQENNVGSYASTYQRRKRLQQEEASQFLNQTFDSHCGSYHSSSYVKALGTREYSGVTDSREGIFSDDNSHYYGRFVDNETFTSKNESSDYTGGGGGRQRSLSRNMQQQTLVETYSSIHERQKLIDKNTYRPLRTAPSPLTRVSRELPNFNSQDADSEKDAIFRSRDRRTKDVQQRAEVDPTSSDPRENGRPFSENFADPHRRRLRSLSPTQLHQSRQFVRLASSRYHAASMYDIDKATVNEEEYNARNKRHFSTETRNYNLQNSNKEESRCQVTERARESAKSASSSSPDRSDRRGVLADNRDAAPRDYGKNSNKSNNNNNDDDDDDDDDEDDDDGDGSGSSTPRSQYADPAFDVITQQTTSRQSRDDVDSFFGGPPYTGNDRLIIDFFTYLESLLLRRKYNGGPSFDATFYFPTLNITTPVDDKKVERPIEGMDALIEDEASKEWSSEDEMKPTSRIGTISRHSERGEPIAMVDENCNGSTTGSSSEQPESRARRRSIVSVIANERVLPYEEPNVSKESLQTTSSTRSASPKKSESLYQSPNHSTHHLPLSNLSPSKRNSRCGSRNLLFEHQTGESRDSSEERLIASIVPEDASIRSLDTGRPQIDVGMADSPTIIIASRPHSHETTEYVDNTRNIENASSRSTLSRNNTQESTEEEFSVNDNLEDRQSKDSASETNTEPGILKIESGPMDVLEARRRIPSKVPVRGTSRYRTLSTKKAAEKPSEKCKRMVQQCFTQLENKDWEITMRGLKSLSQISKQSPEYLEIFTVGTIARLLGRHVRNLRSQVARAACHTSGDVFSSQIRGIDQDLDEIAGPLLHRTADTNRFLRADCNAALDQMVQHLPPHKTIGVIVLRGASHQNAIVRAATARLLSDIIDNIGPDHVMILPRDVRDKLLNTGAKMLMDGNLDARNHAKRMFRRLTRCEGFRKALTDAVPEATLRHIDKIMKTL
ncbi:uncharacterized protein LOC116849305 isoform X2 [Odontomachus brunneus]|uniref:uncharacterized protein LOC116849305 isoform X2 n=1 Tax=Odontomachus brunneus TaxID=486640 RepID=UPI0013F1D0B3|nr:uncharacterized protein LOC116849305 isoform X2 [Odontomachus brunneus]